jgi:predicted DNA-binding transcriptional regulator YafY
MTTTATRLLTLIMLLQRRSNQKAGDLAAALGVSVRTLHRYMGMLDEMGIPVYSERGPYGGFSLVRGYKMPPLIFSPQEATAVYLGASLVEEMWGKLYQDAARGVLAKLDNVLPDEQRQEVAWARRALHSTGLHRADIAQIVPYLEKLRNAIRDTQRVEMVYHGRGKSQPQARRVDPYALVHRWGWWYMVGFCHMRQAVRSFRLDRIQELTLLDERFTTPVDFNLQEYLAAEPVAQPQVHIRLRFNPEGAVLATDNRTLWENLEAQPDGSVIVETSVPDLTWAASLTLSYGPLVVTLEPQELRTLVREWALATSVLYDGTTL